MSSFDTKVLSIISRLLDYPDVIIFENKPEVLEIIRTSGLSADLQGKLYNFADEFLSQDLMDCQSAYDGLFERGRSLGLWLFEHVHGESRDRGQAMVDLLANYREAGLEISQHELPDYIPLFLEFLATQGEANARSWLLDVDHILALLLCRLENRNSNYAILFEVLLNIAGSEVSLEDVRKNIAGEKRDDSKAALDKEWEEEEVTFGTDSLEKSCESAKRRPSDKQDKSYEAPLHWVGFDEEPNKSDIQSREGAAK